MATAEFTTADADVVYLNGNIIYAVGEGTTSLFEGDPYTNLNEVIYLSVPGVEFYSAPVNVAFSSTASLLSGSALSSNDDESISITSTVDGLIYGYASGQFDFTSSALGLIPFSIYGEDAVVMFTSSGSGVAYGGATSPPELSPGALGRASRLETSKFQQRLIPRQVADPNSRKFHEDLMEGQRRTGNKLTVQLSFTSGVSLPVRHSFPTRDVKYSVTNCSVPMSISLGTDSSGVYPRNVLWLKSDATGTATITISET